MQYTALSFELLNLFFFVVLTAIGLARYTFFRGVWASMLRHPVQSLFLGCFPMGLSNLIVGAVGTIHGYFNFGGTGFLYALWGLWWADVVMSMAICFGQLHIMYVIYILWVSCIFFTNLYVIGSLDRATKYIL